MIKVSPRQILLVRDQLQELASTYARERPHRDIHGESPFARQRLVNDDKDKALAAFIASFDVQEGQTRFDETLNGAKSKDLRAVCKKRGSLVRGGEFQGCGQKSKVIVALWRSLSEASPESALQNQD
jgi:hypothetical protein